MVFRSGGRILWSSDAPGDIHDTSTDSPLKATSRGVIAASACH